MTKHAEGLWWGITLSVLIVAASVAILIALMQVPRQLPAPFGDTDIHQVQP